MLKIVPVSLFSKKKRVGFALLSGLLAVGIFLVDLQFPREVAIELLYITVVLISLKSPLFQDTLFSALLVSALILIDYFYSVHAVATSISLTNLILYLGTIWTTAGICILRKKSDRERQELQHLIVEESEKENKLSMALPLSNFLSTLLRLGIESKILKDGLKSQGNSQPPEVTRFFEHVDQAIEHASQLTNGINAAPIDSPDLITALRELALRTALRPNVQCHFTCTLRETGFEKSVALHVYRFAQAALQNAIEHRNKSEINMTLEQTGNRYELKFYVKGIQASTTPEDKKKFIDLIQYRAEMAGASVENLIISGGEEILSCSFPDSRATPNKPDLTTAGS